jgi:uncharacterized protein (DUF433 family)
MIDTQNLTPTEYPHIVLNADNIPLVAGTTLKVVEIVMAQRAYGWTPEEFQINHRNLSMSQIYSALAYYWHKTLLLLPDLKLEEFCHERFPLHG